MFSFLLILFGLDTDRGLLKIMEEEFSGPPMNVSFFFPFFLFSLLLICLIILFLFVLVDGSVAFCFSVFYTYFGWTAGGGRVASRVSVVYVGCFNCTGKVPIYTPSF